VLGDAGVSVACAGTDEEVLAFLRSLPVDVKIIVTDHVMPGTSGSIFVRHVRELCPSVPVFAIQRAGRRRGGV
jgi:CheY-like chemotaxis protein